MHGEVLASNHKMLRLVEKMGFRDNSTNTTRA